MKKDLDKTDQVILKEVLELLIDKIHLYYVKRKERIREDDFIKKLNLDSFITDAIVDINNALLDNAMTFEYVRKINSKLRDSEINNLINKNDLTNIKLR